MLTQKKAEIESQLQELTSKKTNIEKEIKDLRTSVAEGEKAILSMDEAERGPGSKKNCYPVDSSSYSETFLDSRKTREYIHQGMRLRGSGVNQTSDSQWQWSKGQNSIIRKRRNNMKQQWSKGQKSIIRKRRNNM